jgi:hypothetical protein
MPDLERPAQVEEQSHDNEQVTQESGQNGRAEDGLEFLHIEDVNHRAEGKSPGSQADTAKDIKADPQAPREPVIQTGSSTQAVHETDEG